MALKGSTKFFHRLSTIFQPIAIIPKGVEAKRHEITSKSQKLMLDLGLIRQASPGCFHFLPIGLRSINKLIKLVDTELRRVGGQKVAFPTLTNAKLWETSGRLADVSSELFMLKDRHGQEYILSPTHEEAASDLLTSFGPLSYKTFPLKLYQITNKYRDEMKPRFGLMRGKQFLMKDMYSFDVDIGEAKKTYDLICSSYDQIFNKIGIDFVKVVGSTGHIGGSISHEYHYKADVGEDRIVNCKKCNYTANAEVSGEEKCPQCGNDSLELSFGIEVGHTFLLEEKYSKPFKTNFLAKDGKFKCLQMGCFGLGLSRIIAASIEVLSSQNEIRWPTALAPYLVAILPPKSGSKEESHLSGQETVENLYSRLEELQGFEDNVLIDDRTNMTIGKRFLEAKRMGYPFIIVLGHKIVDSPPLYEFNNLVTNEQLHLTETDLVNYLSNNVKI